MFELNGLLFIKEVRIFIDNLLCLTRCVHNKAGGYMENIEKIEMAEQTFFKFLHRRWHFPRILAFFGFEKILHGSEKKMLDVAEKLAGNQQEMENKIIKNILTGNIRGQIFGFILGLLAVGAVYLCIIFKQPIGAIVPAIIPIIGLAVVFTKRKTP